MGLLLSVPNLIGSLIEPLIGILGDTWLFILWMYLVSLQKKQVLLLPSGQVQVFWGFHVNSLIRKSAWIGLFASECDFGSYCFTGFFVGAGHHF